MTVNIERGEVSLIHPHSGSYVLIDMDGNVRIGTRDYGDAFFINGITGDVTINANSLRLVVDHIHWNDLEMNGSAISPSQPTFIPSQQRPINKELSRYGN